MSAETAPTNRNWIIVLVILLLVLPLCCMVTLCGTFALGVGVFSNEADFGEVQIDGVGDFSELESFFEGDRETATDSFDETFEVRGRSNLVVRLEVGSVKVVVGDDDAIVVEGEIKAYGSTTEEAEKALGRVDVHLGEVDDIVEITAEFDEPLGWSISSPKVDLTVTVPELTTADIEVEVGDVEIEDTEGDLRIYADVGDVSIRDVRVRDSMEVTADIGEIDFRGELRDGALYQMTCDVGKITMKVPADSSFEVDASSDVGDVKIDFDVDGDEDRDFVSKTVEGFVGDEDTGTQLILRTDVGAVNIESM